MSALYEKGGVRTNDGAVVFVHGFMGSPEQLEWLERTARETGWDAHFITLPGHGAGVSAFTASNKNDWQRALDALLDEMREKYKEIALVTHSMGGLLAINSCAKNSDKIKRIAALALPLYIKLTLEGARMRLRSVGEPRECEDARITAARELRGVSGITPLNSIRLLPNLAGLLSIMRSTRRLLKTRMIPLTVINSTADEIVSQRSTRFIVRYQGGCERVTLTESSHFWYSDGDKLIIERALADILRDG